MQKTRWQNHVLPKLLNESKKLGIVGDAFPEPIVPTAQLLVTWPNVSNWLGKLNYLKSVFNSLLLKEHMVLAYPPHGL